MNVNRRGSDKEKIFNKKIIEKAIKNIDILIYFT